MGIPVAAKTCSHFFYMSTVLSIQFHSEVHFVHKLFQHSVCGFNYPNYSKTAFIRFSTSLHRSNTNKTEFIRNSHSDRVNSRLKFN